MLKLKTLIVMLVAVGVMATGAQAVFTDDFESYGGVGSTVTTGTTWEIIWSGYADAVIEQDTGTNGTKVMDLVSGGAWGSARHNLAVGDQYSAGYVQFDMIATADSQIRQFFMNENGENIMDLSYWYWGAQELEGTGGAAHDPGHWALGPNWDDPPDNNEWHTLRFDFDTNASGGLGSWTLTVDGVPGQMSGDMMHDGSAGGTSLVSIGWDIAAGDSAWFDNVTVAPEPATMVLLGFGGVGVLLRRRRK